MAAMSDWLERILASHMFGTGTFSKPTVIAVALCSGSPADAATGATIPELPNAGAYARQTLNPAQGNWLDPTAADGNCENMLAITFPQATNDWGWVSGVAVLDSATYGAGNVLLRGAVTTPKNIGTSDQFIFASGAVDVTFA